MSTLRILTRKDCHLCDEMKALVERVARERQVAVEVVDVDSDPALAGDFGLEVPVLFLDGVKIAKFRIEEPRLRARLGRDRSPNRRG
jgi:glutaredoxin